MKNKKFLYIIPLIVVLLLVLAYFLLLSGGKTVSSSSDIAVISVDKNNIAEITLNNQNGKFTLVFDGGIWRFKEDLNLPVLQSRALGIAYDVATVFAEKKVENNALNLSMYGLSPAVAEIIVTMNDGKSYTILMGNRLDDQSGYYLKTKSDNTVYIVDIGKGQNFKASMNDLTNFNILDISREDIKSITVSNREEEQFIANLYNVSDGVKQWIMTYPTRWPVSLTELEAKVFNPVISLKAKDFIKDSFDYNNFIETNKSYVGITDLENNSKFIRLGNTDDNSITTIYADGMYYPILSETKLSQIKDFKAIDFISRIDCEFLGKDVKSEAIINGKRIDNLPYDKLKMLVISEQLPKDEYVYSGQYLRFYNGNDEIIYRFYYYTSEKYAVSTDGNVYFSIDKYLVNQIANN